MYSKDVAGHSDSIPSTNRKRAEDDTLTRSDYRSSETAGGDVLTSPSSFSDRR